LWGTITCASCSSLLYSIPHYAQRCVDPAAVLIHHAAKGEEAGDRGVLLVEEEGHRQRGVRLHLRRRVAAATGGDLVEDLIAVPDDTAQRVQQYCVQAYSLRVRTSTRRPNAS
jgi:hypothetical protein